MAYALNFPNAPTDAQTPGIATTETTVRKGFFARLLAGIERAQMVRLRRELQIYAPDLHESLFINGGYGRIRQSDAHKLPFVK